jgi:hypothetical protein
LKSSLFCHSCLFSGPLSWQIFHTFILRKFLFLSIR